MLLATTSGEIAEAAHGAVAGANKAESERILIAIFANNGSLGCGDDEVGGQRKCLIIACDHDDLGVIAERLIDGFWEVCCVGEEVAAALSLERE